MQYPLQLRFKVLALASQIYVTDAGGATVFYVKQKLLKLKEDIAVCTDDTQAHQAYTIKADRIIDFSASYAITDAHGKKLGAVKRQGMRSLWKARFDVTDEAGQPCLTIQEENPWVKVFESLVGEIPVVGFVVNYLMNPSYVVLNTAGHPVLRLIKRPSIFGRHFEIAQVKRLSGDEEPRAILALLMMVLLERQRG